MAVVLLLIAIGCLQAQEYRPVSLGDLVKATGSNRDGLDEVDLTPFVADHAIFGGQAFGFAARVRDDPAGAVFVAWRRTGELWQSRWVDAASLEGVRVPAEQDLQLGRVEGLRELGPHVVLETRGGPTAAAVLTTVVLAGDLSPVAHVAGAAKLALPSGAIVLQRDGAEAGDRIAELALLDPDARRAARLYTARAPGGRATIASLQYDAARDALTFVVVLRADSAAASDRTARVTCASMRSPAPRCG